MKNLVFFWTKIQFYRRNFNVFAEIFRIRKVLENKSNTEEDRVAIVEQQLAQAKLIAEEADKKYEEVKYRHRRLLHSVQTFDFCSKIPLGRSILYLDSNIYMILVCLRPL